MTISVDGAKAITGSGGREPCPYRTRKIDGLFL